MLVFLFFIFFNIIFYFP